MENFENYESENLHEINHKLCDFSEMIEEERYFLNGIIRHYKPKKILEVGVAHGGSTAIILNAIKDINDAKLFSCDISEDCYRGNGKKTGYIVSENFGNLTDKWTLYTGNVVAKYMENVGNDIDMVLLDTAHYNPGEYLDYLMVLPYLKKNAVVIIHDSIYHLLRKNYDAIATTCGNLFAILKGKKMYIENSELEIFSNIAAVELNKDAYNDILDIFWALTFPWHYLPGESDQEYIIELFNKFYDKKYVDIYMKIIEKHKEKHKEKHTPTSEINTNQLNKTIDFNIYKLLKKSLRKLFIFLLKFNYSTKILFFSCKIIPSTTLRNKFSLFLSNNCKKSK